MATHNYEDRGLPDGMELEEQHKHSDGEEMADVNSYHAKMTAGVGSSEEQYADTSKDKEEELPDAEGGKAGNKFDAPISGNADKDKQIKG